MVLDYSKWDNLELSDDSDIEVHPNVDKKSFIRAKQRQIHEQRAQRKVEIATRKYEMLVNKGLLQRIDALLSTLQKYATSSSSSESKEDPEEIINQSIMESAANSELDSPPPRPKEVDDRYEEQPPSYSKMLASLFDQVKEAVEKREPDDAKRLPEYIEEIQSHRAKIAGLQDQALKRLNELEKLEGSKITSESIHYGVDSSYIAKSDTQTSSKSSAARPANITSSVELLNSPTPTPDADSGHAEHNVKKTAGSEADDSSAADDEDSSIMPSERTIKPSNTALKFLKLPPNDYSTYLSFIGQHPEVLAEENTNGLLMRAFDLQHAGKETNARHAVHQALLLQYCRALGKDGVAMFFKRINTQGHQARKVFFDDVNSTYNRLRDRDRELTKESLECGNEGEEGVEQIQLHAVNPGQKINIVVPPAPSSADDLVSAERQIFNAFPPGLQRALETGELDEVNKILGKMSVEQAEEVVEQLSEGGMLSMEEGVIDATTEEGRRQMEEIERKGREVNETEEAGAVPHEAEGKLSVDEVD